MKIQGRLPFIAAAGLALAVLGGCTTPGPVDETTPVNTSVTTQATDQPADGTVNCDYEPAGAPTKPVDPPEGTNVPASGEVTITLHMNAGDVVMNLDRAGAPCAVHSLVSLVSQGYLDDTICHRLAPGFVLQCGDPSATGRGGPGYRFADELSGRETYHYGTVAMANAGPNTNGSQFFIVLSAVASLPPSYVVMGTVDQASMSVVEAIAAQGVDPTDPNRSDQGGRPAEGGQINSASLD